MVWYFGGWFVLFTVKVPDALIDMFVLQDQHDPSRNRGFLFVEYYNHACADGSQLTVSWAEPKGSTYPSSATAQIGQAQILRVLSSSIVTHCDLTAYSGLMLSC